MRLRILCAVEMLALLTAGCSEAPVPERTSPPQEATAAIKPGLKRKRAPKPLAASATKPAMQTAPVD